MARATSFSYLRCVTRAAAPELGVNHLQLSARQLGCGFPGLGRKRIVAEFEFNAHGWERRNDGDWENVTQYHKIDTKCLRRLQCDAAIKVKVMARRRTLKTVLQDTVGDLLNYLTSGPAHLTLELISTSDSVLLNWHPKRQESTEQESDSPVSVDSVVEVRDKTDSCAGEEPGVSSLSGTEDETQVSANNVPGPESTSSAAVVDDCAVTGKSAQLDAPRHPHEMPEASLMAKTPRSKKPRRHVQTRGMKTMKGPSWTVMLTWVLLLLALWLVSLKGKGVAWKEADWAYLGLQCILFVATGLVVVCKAFQDHWRPVCHQKEKSIMKHEVMEGQTDDEQFLRRHISFLTQEQIDKLETGSVLGCGGNGSVRQILYEGTEAVIKEFHNPNSHLPLMREARFMAELGGAGGMPRILAVGLDPAAIVQEFVGKTYDKFLRRCSVGSFLDSLVSICHRLKELHDKGVVHNDFKIDNVTFSGSVDKPVYHIIDLGWASNVGQVAGDFTLDGNDDVCRHNNGEEDEAFIGCPWMAPEVRARQPVYSSGDVYSFGFLLQYLMQSCKQGFLTEPLGRQAELCLLSDPKCRPSLTEVAEAIAGLQDELLPHQLGEDFHFVESE